MHFKRQEIPKNWPVPRKGTTYLVKPLYAADRGIPILVVLRDILDLAENKKEVKQAIHLKQIMLNHRTVKDEKHPVVLFDTISIAPLKKSYRLEIAAGGKFMLNEIKDAETEFKIAKVVNKKTLKGKKTQLNLSDGRNFISNVKCDTNDSVLVNLKAKKIEECLPFKENAKVFVFAGKHAGSRGVVKKIDSEKEMSELDLDGKNVNVLIKQIMVTK